MGGLKRRDGERPEAVVVPAGMKQCRGCGEVKPRDDYHNYVSSSDGKNKYCKPCTNAKNRAWKLRHPEKVSQSRKSYRVYNAEKIRDKYRQKVDRHGEEMAAERQKWRLAVRYGITIEQYEQLYARCEGKCEICRRPLSLGRNEPHRACVDHDHATGKVRGILCRKCNVALGTFGDNIDGILRVYSYLLKGAAFDDE